MLCFDFEIASLNKKLKTCNPAERTLKFLFCGIFYYFVPFALICLISNFDSFCLWLFRDTPVTRNFWGSVNRCAIVYFSHNNIYVGYEQRSWVIELYMLPFTVICIWLMPCGIVRFHERWM